jgi:SAM-dependent methyltransferase
VSRKQQHLGGLGPDEIEYYSDGAWYDAEYVHIGGDIAYWAKIAAEACGPVLELACGTGRLSIPMAQAGADVFGVDVAPGMIAQANKKRAQLDPEVQERLHFMIGDMRRLKLDRKFAAVILAFNTLMHMTRDADLEAVLATVKSHLGPEGLFHLEVHTPHPAVVPREDPQGRYDPQQMIDPRNGHRYVVSENNEYDPRHQINTMRFFYQRVDAAGSPIGQEWSRTLRLRVIFPRELDRWLESMGFRIVDDWDDFERTQPFTGQGGRRVLAARLA